MIRYIAKAFDKNNPDDVYIWGRQYVGDAPGLILEGALYKPVLFKSRESAIRTVKKHLFDHERLVIVKYSRVHG